jgi:hypothetical protein
VPCLRCSSTVAKKAPDGEKCAACGLPVHFSPAQAVNAAAGLDKTPSDDILQMQPLELQTAKKVIRFIAETGTVHFTKHAKEELLADARSTQDCLNAMRAGKVLSAEFENGGWRYRVETGRVCTIVELESGESLFVITAWRTER